MVLFFWRGTILSEFPDTKIGYVLSRLGLLQPDHDDTAVVALVLQITAAHVLIITIQYKGDLTDMLKEKISAGQAEMY